MGFLIPKKLGGGVVIYGLPQFSLIVCVYPKNGQLCDIV